MWFIGVEVEQETSAPPPKKNPGSVPAHSENRDQRMRQMAAYKRLKTMENHQLSGPKSVRGRLQERVVY